MTEERKQWAPSSTCGGGASPPFFSHFFLLFFAWRPAISLALRLPWIAHKAQRTGEKALHASMCFCLLLMLLLHPGLP
jgi:hypothetical protein